jgi:uncharacterized phosphosugar-binding protein
MNFMEIENENNQMNNGLQISDADIQLLSQQTGVDNQTALETLRRNKGDIVISIMELTVEEPDKMRDSSGTTLRQDNPFGQTIRKSKTTWFK